MARPPQETHTYKILKKRIPLAELGKPFTLAEGRIVGVVPIHPEMSNDLSTTFFFIVEVSNDGK